MELGKAVAIFKNIFNSNEGNEEKRSAIKIVLDMGTHNGISKQEFINALEWLACNEGWISVEERLPKIEGVYDVSIINGKGESVVCTWQFLAGIHLSGRQTYVDGMHYWANNYNGDPINEYLSKNVVAWRERPEPYRPETND